MIYLTLSIPLVVMVFTLRLMGRRWWCECGTPKWWGSGPVCQSQHLFDRWMVSHFMHGGFFYAAVRGFSLTQPVLFSLVIVLVIEALWEIVENTPWVIAAYRKSGDVNYEGDSILNSVSDLLSCFSGSLFVRLFV